MENHKSVYWCAECDVPLIQPICENCYHTGIEIGPSLKPVFKKELEHYKTIMIHDHSMDESRIPPIFYRDRNKLYSNVSLKNFQKYHFTIQFEETKSGFQLILDPSEITLRRIRSDLTEYFIEDPTYLQILTQANSSSLHQIEEEALKFIEMCAEKYNNMHIVCSFSGGKDSAVTAHLVKQALGKIPLIFSDTRIEYPETIAYVKEQGPFFGNLVYLQSQNNFLDLCRKLGPPSRMMRWCCSTQKAGPVNQYYTQFQEGILSFDGIRRSESRLRANYPREKNNTKLIKQFSAYPVIEWNDLEIWLYVLWKQLPMNELYQHGYARIGCWGCPNNGKFDTYLLYKTHPEITQNWDEFLNTYMENSASDYEFNWITSGAWKMRRVHYENEDIGLNYQEEDDFEEDSNGSNLPFSMTQPCLGTAEFVISFQIDPPPALQEFLSVFGELKTKKIGPVEIWTINSPKINIKYFTNNRQLKFEVKNEKDIVRLQQNVIKQINKSLNCIACGACTGSCPEGAIFMGEQGFKIQKEKCVHCLICCTPRYLGMSCVALHYAAKRKLVHRSDIQTTSEA